MSTYVVVTVEVLPGRTLPNGQPAGEGGRTTYGVALTTNGIDRQPVKHPPFTRQIEAQRYADRLQRRLDEESE